MGSIMPMELRLSSSNIIGRFVAKISKIDGASDKISMLGDYINRLQDEMKKIDAFKRELPICVDLVDEAIVAMKEELSQYKRLSAVPKFEEFMKSNNGVISDEKDEKIKENDNTKNNTDKTNWLQLCNSDNQHRHQNKDFIDNKLTLNLDNNFEKRAEEEEIKRPKMESLFQIGENRTVGKTFVLPIKRRFDELSSEVPGLSLGTPEMTKNPMAEIHSKSSSSRSGSSSGTNGPLSFKDARKQRRCWSPELHRRFVNALQQLGGAQAATPKQIRDLMQVDGLTNDEVKSHLQKYRLHARRTPPATKTSAIQPVVFGRLLATSLEQRGESPKRSNSQTRSPQGPLNLTASSQATSMTGADSMDDEDDEKSESHCWKDVFHLSK